MTFPFNIITDEKCDPNTIYLIVPRYKTVLEGTQQKRVLDLDATALASFKIDNIGSPDSGKS